MIGQSITRNSILLGSVRHCLPARFSPAPYLLTKDRIAEEIRKAEEKALLQIVPRARHDNSMLDDTCTCWA